MNIVTHFLRSARMSIDDMHPSIYAKSAVSQHQINSFTTSSATNRLADVKDAIAKKAQL